MPQVAGRTPAFNACGRPPRPTRKVLSVATILLPGLPQHDLPCWFDKGCACWQQCMLASVCCMQHCVDVCVCAEADNGGQTTAEPAGRRKSHRCAEQRERPSTASSAARTKRKRCHRDVAHSGVGVQAPPKRSRSAHHETSGIVATDTPPSRAATWSWSPLPGWVLGRARDAYKAIARRLHGDAGTVQHSSCAA